MAFDNRERQLAELVLLESMYPTEYTLLTTLPSSSDSTPVMEDPKFTLQLQPSYTLEITLPSTYPSTTPPQAYLTCSGDISTSDRKTARGVLEKQVKDLEPGIESLDILVQDFSAWLETFITTASESTASHDHTKLDSTREGSTTTSSKVVRNSEAQGETQIKRTLLWSHHLLATSKRKDIIAWSRELHLSGYSRPGYPGAIFIEGMVSDVDEFVTRIKALRWQALQVRAEEFDASGRRVFGEGKDGVMEVEGLGEIVEAIKNKDQRIAEMFMEGMKIGH